MATIYLGLGSNVEPEKNLSLAVRELRQHYGGLDASDVYRSAAVGFDGDDFLNLVVRIQSDETASQVAEEIERLAAMCWNTVLCYGRLPSLRRNCATR